MKLRISQKIALAICCAIVGYGIWTVFQQWQLQGWHTAPLIDIHVKPDRSNPDSDGEALFKIPSATFRYAVGDSVYSSSRINPSPLLLHNPDPATAKVCWHNPDDPSEAYLTNDGITVFPVAITVVFTIVATLIIADGIRRHHKPERHPKHI